MTRRFLSVVLLVAVCIPGVGFSQQDDVDTPSKKTKEAVDKLKQAPSGIGKAVGDAVEAVKEKITGGARGGQKAPAPADSLVVPEKRPERVEAPPYSSAGRRDPFQSLALKAQTRRRPRENLSPLERYELGQLKLVGIIWNMKQPRAMVEDSAGLGYVVGIGTAIGPDEGKIREIKPNEVVIEESYVDFYGARKNRRVSMKLVSQ